MFSHLALRLAAVEALAPTAKILAECQGQTVTDWPTLARHRVLDSQIEAAAATEAEAMTPIIGVFTDDSETEAQGEGQDAEAEPYETVTLAFEVQVPVVSRDEQGLPVIGTAETDALAEAFVNTICAQIRAVLARARMDGPLRHVLVMVSKTSTRAWSDADTMVRLSARRIEMSCRVRADGELRPGEVGLDRLPSPLREVALDLPANSYGRLSAERVASILTDADALPALQEMRLAVNLARAAGETPPARNPAPTPPTGDVGGQVLP